MKKLLSFSLLLNLGFVATFQAGPCDSNNSSMYLSSALLNRFKNTGAVKGNQLDVQKLAKQDKKETAKENKNNEQAEGFAWFNSPAWQKIKMTAFGAVLVFGVVVAYRDFQDTVDISQYMPKCRLLDNLVRCGKSFFNYIF